MLLHLFPCWVHSLKPITLLKDNSFSIFFCLHAFVYLSIPSYEKLQWRQRVLDKCQKIILVRFVSWISNLEIISFFKKSDEISLYCSKNHCKILRFLLKSWRNFWQLLFEPCFRWLLRRWKNILLITVLLYFQSFENMLSTCTFFKSTTFISI